MRLLLTIFLASSVLLSFGQESQRFTFERKSVGSPLDEGVDLHPRVFHIAPESGGEAYKAFLKKQKSKIGPKKYGNSPGLKKSALSKPRALLDFRGREGNGILGIPNDNDIAISNDGAVISVTNSEINFFDSEGTFLDRVSLQKFGESLNIEPRKYDPKVLYDPNEDKFVIAYLSGRTDSTSDIIFAFSQTNDPLGNWNFYSISGNPLNDTSWSDFPMITLTEDELFLTINLLYNDSSWQKGFKQTVVWQMDKYDGYNGDALDTKLHTDIGYQGKPVRNIFPAQGGSGLGGPDLWLLSNRNFALETDTFFLIKLTGTMDDPQNGVEVKVIKSDVPYGVPPEANQPSGLVLQTNDARVLGGYFEDGNLHFVGNTVNPDNNLATIYHGKIESPANWPGTFDLEIFKQGDIELGYPNMAYTGENGEDEALIMVNHTSRDSFPGYSSFYYSDEDYSDQKWLKLGERIARPFNTTRWGDYTGIQRVYNEGSTVWVSGYYGRYRPQGINDGVFDVNDVWIHRLQNPYAVSISEEKKKRESVKVFPNPVEESIMYVDFDLPKADIVNFRLYNSNGQVVTNLPTYKLNEGKNKLSIDLADLPSGTYYLKAGLKYGESFERKLIKL